ELILRTADAIPAISASSRNDLAAYAQANDLPLPPGAVTRLPCGITPAAFPTATEPSSRPWPRPYALFVGTVESRKQHILALQAWQQLIDEVGADAVPDLVCIGRLGWHSDAFLDGYVRSHGLGGKVALLSASVPDDELAAFYAHAQFTIYPSRYEGWGLPVSESLAFGKVPVITASSSLPEAGGDLAVYLVEPTAQALATSVRTQVLDEQRLAHWEQRIAQAQGQDERLTITWTDVAETIRGAVGVAGSVGMSGGTAMAGEDARGVAQAGIYPTVELGREYVLAGLAPMPDSGYSDQVMRHLQDEGLTPLLRQPREATDYRVVDPAVVGHLGSPQTWGIEVRPGAHALIRFTRPVDGPLVVLLATRSMPGVVRIEATGPGGPVFDQVYLGAALTLPVGDGSAGEPAQVRLTVTDASDSIEGFLGLRSFVILRA
ncbi:MAG: glycosyltransferase family 4 protein, partial [Actinomycetales bacterium]